MAGPAGNRDYYEVRVGNRVSHFPRVTTVCDIIGKPAIADWSYRHTRDVISGVVSVLTEAQASAYDILELLRDADDLEEYLKANQLRPNDIKEAAGAVGTEKHKLFQLLGEAALSHTEDADITIATQRLDSADGYERAIADWWLATRPKVVASELTLVSFRHQFAGTTDLVHTESNGTVTITDLKNRKADEPCAVNHKTEEAAERCHARGGPYETDHVQTGGYEIAWLEERGIPVLRRTVLIAQPDGRWRERESTIPSSTFLDALALYNKLRRNK